MPLTRVSPQALTSVLVRRGAGIAIGLMCASFALAAPDPKGASGTLTVSSDPIAAAVFVDGRPAGHTPLTIQELSPGDHRVLIAKADYLDHSRVIGVGAGRIGAWHVRLTPATQSSGASSKGLQIVVIEGEGAVNIIQQRTAVAPVVEVRDRNNQPVAGAVVRFAIRNGRATFAGARNLTAATNAAGRAVATGLTPTGSGAVQISASAAFQGQTAALTIAQTNVMTAAQAAQVAAASTVSGSGTGSGAAAGGAGAGGGGSGASLTTLSVVGGAAAGGAIAAKELLAHKTIEYRGPLQMQSVTNEQRTTGGTTVNVCGYTLVFSGTVTIEILEGTDEVGDFSADYSITEVSRTCTAPFTSPQQKVNDPATGTTQNIQFSRSFQETNSNASGTSSVSFSGVLANDVVTGTYSTSSTFKSNPDATGSFNTSTIPTTTGAVTLQRQ